MTLKTWIKIALPPFIILLIHTVLTYTLDIYHLVPWFDTPMHFVGGISIALSANFYINAEQKSGNIGYLSIRNRVLLILGSVVLAAVLWECVEYLGDVFIKHYNYYQPSNADTMKDLFMGMTGGLLTAIIASIKD